MEIVVHNKNFVSIKFQKKLCNFNRHELQFLALECDVKNISNGLPQTQKIPTSTPPKNLRLRNSGLQHELPSDRPNNATNLMLCARLTECWLWPTESHWHLTLFIVFS